MHVQIYDLFGLEESKLEQNLSFRKMIVSLPTVCEMGAWLWITQLIILSRS